MELTVECPLIKSLLVYFYSGNLFNAFYVAYLE